MDDYFDVDAFVEAYNDGSDITDVYGELDFTEIEKIVDMDDEIE